MTHRVESPPRGSDPPGVTKTLPPVFIVEWEGGGGGVAVSRDTCTLATFGDESLR